MDIKKRLLQALEKMNYRWDCSYEYAAICREAYAEIERLEKGLTEAVVGLKRGKTLLSDAADQAAKAAGLKLREP